VIRTRESPVALTAAIFVGAVAVLYFARDILIPLALAITLALVLWPAVAWLRRLHLPRVAATLLVSCPGHNIITSDPSDNHETESVCVANNAGATK
jgi:predicted PurR-regulated permease PerM